MLTGSTIIDLTRTSACANAQRILSGRAGASYRTATWLELRRDHAAAKDAVHAELNLKTDLGTAFVSQWRLFEVATLARTKEQFLMRPDLGRSLTAEAQAELIRHCSTDIDLQVVIADGLSAAAVQAQVPALLPLLAIEAEHRRWQFGQPFFVRHGRVGILNDIGEILNPAVAVLLIGEPRTDHRPKPLSLYGLPSSAWS